MLTRLCKAIVAAALTQTLPGHGVRRAASAANMHALSPPAWHADCVGCLCGEMSLFAASRFMNNIPSRPAEVSPGLAQRGKVSGVVLLLLIAAGGSGVWWWKHKQADRADV